MLSPREMLLEIAAQNISQSVIADRIGSSQPTICRIINGSQTSYETGKKIEELYHELVPLSPNVPPAEPHRISEQ